MSEEGLRDGPEGHLTPPSPRGPRLFWWVLGIYLVAFGVASQRFENHVDRIETKAIIIAATVAAAPPALDGIAKLQRMKRPYPPEIFKPWSVLFSFIPAMESRHPANVEEMRDLVVSFRDQLSERNLSLADLSGAQLRRAHLNRTNLSGANLSGADLREADLRGANLRGTNLQAANLGGAYLHNADLSNADLRGAIGLAERQLTRAKHLNLAYRDPEHAYGKPIPTAPPEPELRQKAVE